MTATGESDLHAGLSPANRVELAVLHRHLRRSRGFSLAFVVVNHQSVLEALVADLRNTAATTIVRLVRGGGGPVTQLERQLDSAPAQALVLVGLEDLVDGFPAPALDNLNLNRDYLARRLACPLLVIAPAWLVSAMASSARDLWSVRSNLFEFVGDTEDALATVRASDADLGWEVPPPVRRARRRLLDDVAEETETTGQVDLRFLAELARSRGRAAELAGDAVAAAVHYQKALSTYRDLGDRLGEANTLRSLADTARATGRYPDAQALLDQALPLYRDLGDRLGEANTLKSLADTALATGRYPDAQALLDQALPIYRDLGDRRGEANTLQSLADTARLTGRYPEARALLDQALPIYRDLGNRLGEANTLLTWGRLRAAMGEPFEAVANYREASRLYRTLGMDYWADVADREAAALPVT
ncbi:MAG TPA: tetratricopeptide repeat protein [Dermatophilaceae bacterium]|nr:tetratricopeptide repeat protein [Dermatophilaceae bacterium]